MPWLIQEINNATHELKLVHPSGEELNVKIPSEHTISDAAKLAWIKAQTDARDIINAAKQVESTCAQQLSILRQLNPKYVIVGIVALAIVVKLLIRLI